MHALGEDAHRVTVIEASQLSLAAHSNAAQLRADDSDIAHDDEAAAALCLVGVVFNGTGRDLTAGLTEGVVHRGEYHAVRDHTAADLAFAEQVRIVCVLHVRLLLYFQVMVFRAAPGPEVCPGAGREKKGIMRVEKNQKETFTP